MVKKEMKKEFGVEIISTITEIIENYALLSNDALIAAICKANGITKIATFDDDFKRVDFLEVIGF